MPPRGAARMGGPRGALFSPGPSNPFAPMALEAGKRARAVASVAVPVEDRSLGRVREEAEREHILSVLRLTEGHRAEAARILGISRKTLWKKLKRLGIARPPQGDVTAG